MLTFESQFKSDRNLGCLIWADEPASGRVRFSIGHQILAEILGGGNPIVQNRNGSKRLVGRRSTSDSADIPNWNRTIFKDNRRRFTFDLSRNTLRAEYRPGGSPA
jgi:hypothetical protein